MSDNAFARILANLDNADSGVTEKTAAAKGAPPDAAERMLNAVRAAATSTQTTKTASAKPKASVAGDLHRMAKTAQLAEAEAMTKQAHLLGSSVCDGFMERFAQYDAALTGMGVKTAGFAGDGDMQKVAQAAYQQAQIDMEKTAEAEFERGYSDMMKFGAADFQRGYEDTMKYGAADFQRGYNDTMQYMQKNGSTDFNQGFNDTIEYIHKTASDIHYIGQQAAHALVKQASQT